VIAIDAAQGETVVDEVHRIDRGYERIGKKLAHRGARIRGVPT